MTSRYEASCVCVARASSGSRYSSAQQSNGVNNHLCGSRMNESACSSPAYFGAKRAGEDSGTAVGAVDVEPPAPLPRQRADAGQVVDDARVGRSRGAHHCRDTGGVGGYCPVHGFGGEPVIRCFDHQCVHLRSRSVFVIDECASEPTTTRRRPVAPRRLAVSRAAARADRLPAEPPDTKHPPDVVGRPASLAIRRSTLFSAAIAPEASSHEMPWIDAQDTSMSNNRLPWSALPG